MKNIMRVCLCVCVSMMFIFTNPVSAGGKKEKILPAPQMKGGMPLMEALKARSSGRNFDTEKMLSDQMLSNLLWAGFGVNRPDTGKRTAPSAMNWQELEIYVVLAEGAYVYDATGNKLKLVVAKDLRELAGLQSYVKTAPVNLVYVSDFKKMATTEEGSKLISWNHAGYVGQNIYLFCASEGLSTVVRASGNREKMAKALKLRPEQHISMFQSVGYPKKQ